MIGLSYVHPSLRDRDCPARSFAEEHALFNLIGALPSDVGHRVHVFGYAPTTVNLHDALFMMRDPTVIDAWPVFPSCVGRCGFRGALR